jgi:hypothetical protein
LKAAQEKQHPTKANPSDPPDEIQARKAWNDILKALEKITINQDYYIYGKMKGLQDKHKLKQFWPFIAENTFKKCEMQMRKIVTIAKA